jgi:ABC-type molybdenum transport system ATPase subunit/photorepair protein PhrA
MWSLAPTPVQSKDSSHCLFQSVDLTYCDTEMKHEVDKLVTTPLSTSYRTVLAVVRSLFARTCVAILDEPVEKCTYSSRPKTLCTSSSLVTVEYA